MLGDSAIKAIHQELMFRHNQTCSWAALLAREFPHKDADLPTNAREAAAVAAASIAAAIIGLQVKTPEDLETLGAFAKLRAEQK